MITLLPLLILLNIGVDYKIANSNPLKMKNLITVPFILVLFQVIGFGQVKVSFDYDKKVDFAQFKSYEFTPSVEQLPINDLNRKRIITAVEYELTQKGFQKSDTPDVMIDIKIAVAIKQSATATTDWYGSAYRYRWGPSFTTTNINVDEYIEGTIFIDMIDKENSRLVWQGRGIGTINENVNAEKREKRIKKSIAKIFNKYPPMKE